MTSVKRDIGEALNEQTAHSLSPKRQKLSEVMDETEQVGATELASAMALASLANFSPKSVVNKGQDDAEHTTEEGSITSWEAAQTTGAHQPAPVTPETRFSATSKEKKVSFAPGVKENERKEGIRRLNFTPRFTHALSRMPPGFARAGGAFGPPRVAHHHLHRPPQVAIWSRHGNVMPPSPGGYMPPPTPRPMVMHPHLHHLPSMQYHAQPPSANQWICDYCNAASFASYEEACLHEEFCRRHSMQHAIRSQQLPFLPGMHPQFGPPPASANADLQKGQLATGVAPPTVTKPEHIDDDRPSASDREWCRGITSLAVPEFDKEWLSEVNCFIREKCVEAFSAPDDEVKKASKRGKLGKDQVGIRCCFCREIPSSCRTAAAVSYPASVAGIYESVKRWQRVHMALCENIPQDIKEKIEELGSSNAWIATTRQYWVDSARALGMVDTLEGIRFGSDPSKEPDTTQLEEALNSKEKMKEGDKVGDGDHIVYPEDVSMVPPYVYFLMRQVESCHFTEADRFVARSKGPVGYPGFQCRHCNGHAGLGKYFPVTAKSLATNSTSQNIHAHLLKCRKTPNDIKAQLVALKEEKTRAPRLEPGWRKVFFDQVWTRLHGTEPEP